MKGLSAKRNQKTKPTKRRFVKQDRIIVTTPIEHNGLSSSVSNQTESQILSRIVSERDVIGLFNRHTPLSALFINEGSNPSQTTLISHTSTVEAVLRRIYHFTTPNTPDNTSQIILSDPATHHGSSRTDHSLNSSDSTHGTILSTFLSRFSFLISLTNLEFRYDPQPLIPFTSNCFNASFVHSPLIGSVAGIVALLTCF
ncbi:hypothetical protein BLNAU_14566 [Blattamonas nauphoetae]|uniref:Uncharacterized protein n=1 Tax=Blattamonas nauphoetae TaxID=2049346 RepID=A0ABQ9XGK3_9EUKA|nr:hypothetical protein BLNAU_14566 [Blattamonas nauphoetae]